MKASVIMNCQWIFVVRMIVCSVFFFINASVQAGFIASLERVDGPAGAFGGVIADSNILNNDDSVTQDNLLARGELEILGIEPIDFVINVSNSGGTTEYFADFGRGFNFSGEAWSGFVFELGLGSGSSFTLLRDLPIDPFLDGLDSDFPDQSVFPQTDIFDLESWEADRIVFQGGGTLLPGESGGASSFYLDVPDSALSSNYQFTIRLYPIVQQQNAVPEPSSVAIFGIGAAAIGFVAYRRKQTVEVDS